VWVWPWHGLWDDLPAAHAASALFDLACVGLVFRLGDRLRGRTTAIVLAYLWLACPWTLFAANSGADDPLVAALILGALVAPRARGALTAAAGMVKLAPLALLPLLTRGWRQALGATAVIVGSLALVLVLDGGLATFADRTFGFQASRASPFSVWGLYDLPALQHLVQAAAVALALGLAVLVRRRDTLTLAAASAAVLLALQLGISHWFYLYLPWVLAPLFPALLRPYALEGGSGRRMGSMAVARPEPSEQEMSTALSQGSSAAAS
jgi:hypothetical protein